MELAATIKSTGPEVSDELQLDLFTPIERSYYKKFLDFHIKYPTIYRLFEKFALQLIEAGHKKLGSKMIMERIRWEVFIDAKDKEGFKINNNYTCYYSRLFIKNNPEYKEFFEFRIIKRI